MHLSAGVASPRHTAGLIIGLLAISIWGAVASPLREWEAALAAPHARILLYFKMLALQWGLVLYVRAGMRVSLRTLIDGAPLSVRRWIRYLGMAIGAWIAWLVVGAVLGAFLRPAEEEMRSLFQMFPKAPIELALWVVFSLSAGFCEEVVYRGYLFRQFQGLTGSMAAALLLQAVVFGMAHLVLPLALVISVGALALLLGGLAIWQKSLIPGMIMHAALGLFGAFASTIR